MEGLWDGAFSSRLFRLLFSRVGIAWLVCFRVVFGAIMACEVWRRLSYGRVRTLHIEPPFFFEYHGFEWMPPWPGLGTHLHFAALGALAPFVVLRDARPRKRTAPTKRRVFAGTVHCAVIPEA